MYKEEDFFKIYNDLPETSDSNFLIIEVEGDVANALDLRSLIEKHEIPGLGICAVVGLLQMPELFGIKMKGTK